MDWKEWTRLDGSPVGVRYKGANKLESNWQKKSSWAIYGFWCPKKSSWAIEKSSWDNIRFQIYSCENSLIICTARSKVVTELIFSIANSEDGLICGKFKLVFLLCKMLSVSICKKVQQLTLKNNL